jgi:hypothetical protein
MIVEHKKQNLSKLPFDDLKEILDICLDELGVVDIQQAREVTGLSRPRIYQLMTDQNTIKIGKHKFISINLLNKKL